MDQYRSITESLQGGVIGWSQAWGGRRLPWNGSSGTQECVTAVMEPVGLGESEAHVEASDTWLPAHPSLVLTQLLAVVPMNILAG